MTFEIPEELGYLETHEWIEIDDGIGTVGITDFAQDELGDVIFLELPEGGESLAQEELFGTIESIKAMSDLYAPMGGDVVDVNERLYDEPELVNQDPYGEGWMIRLDLDDLDEFDALLTADDYNEQIR